MRALVTGWFTPHHGEATVGDLLAAETASTWLADTGVEHDIALSPAFAGALHLDDVDPRRYTHLLWVCGPLSGWQVDQVLDRFGHCTTIALGVSLIDATTDRFDVVLERDSTDHARPDLALAADRQALPPLVGLIRSHPQPEYPGGAHDRVHQIIDTALAGAGVAVIELSTRVEPRAAVGGDLVSIDASIARLDAVVTTRLHGLVLALRRGVPAVAIDPVDGGAKVTRQAQALRWPAVIGARDATVDRIRSCLDWALEPAAADLAQRRADQARDDLTELRRSLIRALA